jgi:hypothetical protein
MSEPNTEAAAPEAPPASATETTTQTEETGAVQPPVADESEQTAPKHAQKNGASEKKGAKTYHGQGKLRTYENGMLKTSAIEQKRRENSKYDPSVLEISADPKEIRGQVCGLRPR